MWSKSFVYVAGFDRGVRPIGDWSMSITLSKHSMPSTDVVLARLHPDPVEPVRERLVDDLVDERRLAGARDAGHADELADREVDVDVLQVVHPARRGPRTRRGPPSRRSGTAIARSPERNCPVTEPAIRSTVVARAPRRRRARRARPRPGPCRRAGRPPASSARRARRRARCCRCRAAARASRSGGRCRAGAARSTARRGCRARRRAASRSASRAAGAAPRRPTASTPPGRAAR